MFLVEQLQIDLGSNTNTGSNTKTPVDVLLRKSPKRKTWALEVKPGGEIVLTTPLQMSSEKIQALLLRHASWIKNKLSRLKNLKPIRLSHPWFDGEEVYLRGQTLKLKLEHASYPSVSVGEKEIVIRAKTLQSHTVKKVFEDWLADETAAISEKLLQKWAPRFELTTLPPLHYRVLKRSWGQCRSDGKITLHKHLSRLHPEFLEYVFVHELCHLFHMNHSRAFKGLLTQHIPHWRELKKSHEPVL